MARSARKAPPKLKLVGESPPWERLEAKARENTEKIVYVVNNCVAHTEGMAKRVKALEDLVYALGNKLGRVEEQVASLGTSFLAFGTRADGLARSVEAMEKVLHGVRLKKRKKKSGDSGERSPPPRSLT